MLQVLISDRLYNYDYSKEVINEVDVSDFK